MEGLSTLEYVLGCGRSVDPVAQGAREILEVTWICGESVEGVRYFRPGTPVWVEDLTCEWRHPFPIPAGLDGGGAGQRLFVSEGRGWALEGGLAGFVEMSGARRALEGEERVEVREGEQVAVEIGGAVFVARLVAEGPALQREPAPLDWAIGAMVSFGGFLVAAMIGAVTLIPPPKVRMDYPSDDPIVILWRQIEHGPDDPRVTQRHREAAPGYLEWWITESTSEELSPGLIGGVSCSKNRNNGFLKNTNKKEDKVHSKKINMSGEPIILGKLNRAQIDEVVERNMASIRYCYRQQLTKEPSLAGKISVKFTIAADGSVSQATTKASTMGNPAVESCINKRFMRFAFPQPKGGGVVIVSYPFAFFPD